MDCVQTFRTPLQLVLDMSFDPSSRFLAAGTADSHVKVFDVRKGFQTHNFRGHRGIIVKVVFIPEVDALKLLSCSEDMQIIVWDLVMKTQVSSIRTGALVTSITFSSDKKTAIVASKDGTISFYNTKDNFKRLAQIKVNEFMEEEEVNSVEYV
mmetsp:Transcript_7436/g.9725  ORF Transcript_7436/g.9725 Transcript_7436/m.9725 type:complete len:153 (-) Transcript_7436:2075-2533(-)